MASEAGAPVGRARRPLGPLLALLPWSMLVAAVLVPGDRPSVVAACLAATTALSAVACWLRVLGCRADRAPWSCTAAGWTAYALGFLVVLYLPGLQPYGPGTLNLSDTVSLALYPCGWTGLVLLARGSVPQARAGLVLDAGIMGSAGTAVALSWAALTLPQLLEGSPVEVVYALAYPVGGATLLVVLLTGLAVLRWRLDGCWALLLAGLVR